MIKSLDLETFFKIYVESVHGVVSRKKRVEDVGTINVLKRPNGILASFTYKLDGEMYTVQVHYSNGSLFQRLNFSIQGDHDLLQTTNFDMFLSVIKHHFK